MEPTFEDDNNSMHPRNLPFDLITQNILTRLPIKPLIRCKSVSTQWYDTISSPQFRHTHLKFQLTSPLEYLLIRSTNQFSFDVGEIDKMSLVNIDLDFDVGEVDTMSLVNIDVDFDIGDETLVLVGSCNGLLCLGSTSGRLFIISNPVTREFRKYSDSEIVDFSPKEFMVTWGFGYVSDVDDYKVVRICKKVFQPFFAVHVFSTKFDKWRRIDNDTSHTTPNFYGLKIAERLRAPGVLVNESLYWMGGLPSIVGWLPRKIICFDLALELFDTFPHLDLSTPSEYATGENGECFDLFLCVVKGSLSKYGRVVGSGGLITVLKHVGETEEIHLSRDEIDSNYGNLIEFKKKNLIFTQYYNYRHSAECLGVITKIPSPMMHKQLIAFENEAKIEIISYSPSLISPLWLQGHTFEDLNN